MTIQSRSPRTIPLSLRGSRRRLAAMDGSSSVVLGASWESGIDLANNAQQFEDGGSAQLRGLEGRRARQQLVEQGAQRIDVASRVHIELAQLRLLGAHVFQRSHH